MQPTPRATTNERLAALESELARQGAMLGEVHLAVVGTGARPSMAERLATLETEATACRSFRRETYWRGLMGTLASFCVSIGASVGLSLHPPLL